MSGPFVNVVTAGAQAGRGIAIPCGTASSAVIVASGRMENSSRPPTAEEYKLRVYVGIDPSISNTGVVVLNERGGSGPRCSVVWRNCQRTEAASVYAPRFFCLSALDAFHPLLKFIFTISRCLLL